MDIYNKRAATGYLAIVEKLQIKVIEGEERKWSGFLVRHVRQSGNKYRVADYWFKADDEIRNALTHININDPVLVNFEIVCEYVKIKDSGYYKTSLKTVSVNKLDGARGKEWYWHVQDYMDAREVAQLKQMYPKTPLIIGEQGEHTIDKTRKVSDIITRRAPFKPKPTLKEEKIRQQDDSDLPF